MEQKLLRVVLVQNFADDVSKFDVVHLIVFNRAKSLLMILHVTTCHRLAVNFACQSHRGSRYEMGFWFFKEEMGVH